MIVARGWEESNGYLAIDNIMLDDNEKCEVIPEYAKPGVVTTPKPETTPSQDKFQVQFNTQFIRSKFYQATHEI